MMYCEMPVMYTRCVTTFTKLAILRATLQQARRYQGGKEKVMVSRSVENERVEVENDVPDDQG